MPKFPQCPRCGDNLSALQPDPYQDPAYPQGVCTLCVSEIQRQNMTHPEIKFARIVPPLTISAHGSDGMNEKTVDDLLTRFGKSARAPTSPLSPSAAAGAVVLAPGLGGATFNESKPDRSERTVQDDVRAVADSIAAELAADVPTLRDRFAAVSLPAFVKIVQATGRNMNSAECYAKAAQHAYAQADAMLKARGPVQPEQPLSASERDELHKLRAFKTYVHARLDAAGVEKDPEGAHKAAGCRIGGRLDIVLAKFRRTELSGFIAMLVRAKIGHGTRRDYVTDGSGVMVESGGGGENRAVTDFSFDAAGNLSQVVACIDHGG